MRGGDANPIDSPRALAALCASNTLGVLILYVIPLIVGATVEGFAVSEGSAGIVAAWELGAMAAASMLLTARFTTLRIRLWTWIGLLAFVSGSALSLLSEQLQSWSVFLASRGVVGVGEGVLFCVSSGLAAQTAAPDRTFAWFSGAHIVFSILAFLAIPAATGWIGPPGAFLAMTAIGLLAAPLIIWTPDRSAAAVRAVERPGSPLGVTAALLLASVACLNLALNTVFPFTERIGESIGLTLGEVGRILSWGALVSVLGPVLAHRYGTRGGRTLTLGLGAASQIAGVLILVYASSHSIWTGGYIVSSAALMYFMPLLYGLVAFYDRSGRINAAASSVTAWMSAAGPLLGGLALNAGGSYRLVGWLAALGYAGIFAFAYRPARAAERGLRAQR